MCVCVRDRERVCVCVFRAYLVISVSYIATDALRLCDALTD